MSRALTTSDINTIQEFIPSINWIKFKLFEKRSSVFNNIVCELYARVEGEFKKILKVNYHIDRSEKSLYFHRLQNETFMFDPEDKEEMVLRQIFKGGANALMCILVGMEKKAGNIDDDYSVSVNPAHITGGSVDEKELQELKAYYKKIGFDKVKDQIILYTEVSNFLHKCFNVKPSDILKTCLNEFSLSIVLSKSPKGVDLSHLRNSISSDIFNLTPLTPSPMIAFNSVPSPLSGFNLTSPVTEFSLPSLNSFQPDKSTPFSLSLPPLSRN